MLRKYLIVLFFMAFAPPLAGQGLAFAANGNPINDGDDWNTMEIVTYYPSPYGYYEELRGDKIIVGDSDNSYVNETDLPPTGTITFDGLPSAPTGNLYESTMYYDTSEHKFKYYYNSWQDLGGGGDYWKPSTASGGTNDIYYAQSGNVGIGVGASEAIGAKLQVKMNPKNKGFLIKTAVPRNLTSLVSNYYFNSNHDNQYFSVPSNLSSPVSLFVTVKGAQGGGNGGTGAVVTTTINANPSEQFTLVIGGRDGYPDGGGGGGSLSVSGYQGGGHHEL